MVSHFAYTFRTLRTNVRVRARARSLSRFLRSSRRVIVFDFFSAHNFPSDYKFACVKYFHRPVLLVHRTTNSVATGTTGGVVVGSNDQREYENEFERERERDREKERERERASFPQQNKLKLLTIIDEYKLDSSTRSSRHRK